MGEIELGNATLRENDGDILKKIESVEKKYI